MAGFCGLSGAHECTGALQMALVLADTEVANGLKTSSKVDVDVRNRFGNILKGLQLKMTTGEAYSAVHVTSKFFFVML